uniref:Uncharacterized protein n=2 Tax=Arundo donax TaxID=35708 RepID=A0A0A8ZIV7_ARUDO
MLKQGGLKGATDSELIERYPLCTFEEKGYYHWFERDFEWYFDPDYCEYARLQDYQRLMLYNNGEYENWEYYRKTCSTLESDQEFVQFWEKLSCQIKRQRIERLAYYHAEKTAAEFPNIFSTLLHSAFTEYMWSIWFDNTWYKDFACLYFEIWKLIAKEKMNFKAALDQVKDKGMQSLCRFEMRAEIESDQLRPGPITRHYETYLAGIDVNVEEGYAYQLIMDAVKKFVPKRKMYYDYAKKKLDIAYEIGVIPPNPHKSST